MCGGSCCFFGIYGTPFGCLIAGAAPAAYAAKPSDPTLVPDGSEEYIDGYVDGYSVTRRMERVKYATIGAVGGGVLTSSAVFALTVLLVAAGS